MKASFIIYADSECLLEKINICHNDPKKLSAKKINKHIAPGYSLFTHCSFDDTKNKPDYYRGKDCIKKLGKDLKEHVVKIINYETKMIPLTIEEKKSNQEQKACYICKKEFSTYDDKKYFKVRDHCHYAGKYREAAHNICNLRYKTPKEAPVVLHNGSRYDSYFIIKELAKGFEGQFECLGENTEKIYNFFCTN